MSSGKLLRLAGNLEMIRSDRLLAGPTRAFGRALTIMAVSVIVSPLQGQSGGGFDLTWSTLDGGGAMNSGGGVFTLSGTVGQPDAQVPPVMTGGSFTLTGGFWPVANVCYCLADVNGDGKKDGRDVQLFVGCVLAVGNCSCADVDAMNGVTLADVPVFVSDLLAGPNCP